VFTLAPLPNGGIAGSAIDVTAPSEAEARLRQHMDAHADTLDRLATAVAIFGPDRRLSFYNRAYVRLWGLVEAWLDGIRARAKSSTACVNCDGCRSSRISAPGSRNA
jgi:PAS domain-containing protein